jgi:hypothetical protein
LISAAVNPCGTNVHQATGYTGLSGGEGNDVLIGSWKKDYFSGGGGHDLLLGGAGDDSLYGDGYWPSSTDGQDVLIGGTGADTIMGGGGEDLLIAGWVAFDQNALNRGGYNEIHRRWRRTDLTYEQRFADVTFGAFTGGSTRTRCGATTAGTSWTAGPGGTSSTGTSSRTTSAIGRATKSSWTFDWCDDAAVPGREGRITSGVRDARREDDLAAGVVAAHLVGTGGW